MATSQARSAERVAERLEKRVDHLLEECRMVVPGAQALFGFQLIAVFNEPFFTHLAFREQLVHMTALVLTAVAVACLMAAAAYHRRAEPDAVSAGCVHYASRMLMIAMATLMLAIALELYVIGTMVLPDELAAGGIAAGVMAVSVVLWFVWPSQRPRRRPAPTR